MSLAIAEAQAAKKSGNLPFGAVVVRNGEVISTGHSMELSEQDVTKHAELMAISKACKNLGSMSLIETTLYASGEPCNMCASAAFQANISTVVIGSTRSDLSNFFRRREIGIQQLANDASHRIEIITGVLKDNATSLFDDIKK